MLGRPASWAPVWKNVTAGSWLIASVCIDLMKQSSSATLGGVRQQLADPGPALAVLGEPESAGRDREALLPRGHAGQPLALPDRVGQLGPLRVGAAAACGRTGPSATARPTGTGRSPASPGGRNWGSPRCRRRSETGHVVGRRRAVAIEQRRQRHRAEAQAGPVRPRNCRRVRCWPSSTQRVHVRLLLGDASRRG